jgi:hypothetical protein
MSRSFWRHVILVLMGVGAVLAAMLAGQNNIHSNNQTMLSLCEGVPSLARTVSGTLIPLKAHFIYGLWDTTPLPLRYEKCIEEWRAQGWDVKVWHRAEVENVIRQYPVWWDLYQGFERRVQAADLARYVVVYNEGGFYFDCDCSPSALSLRNHLIYAGYDWSSVFFVENAMPDSWIRTTAQRFPIREGVNEQHERLANFAFGAVAKHPALLSILHTVEARCSRNPGQMDDYGVLYTTGPDAVTDTLAKLRPSWPAAQLQVIPHSTYMHHHATGTWRNSQDREQTSQKR